MLRCSKKQLFFCVTAICITISFSVSVAAATLAVEASLNVVYPKAEAENDVLFEYPLQLLELAIEKSQAAITLSPSSKYLPKKRALYKLRNKQGVDVLWSLTSKENEEDFLAIKIPLFKGLSGWQIPLVRADGKLDSESIENLEQLKKYSVIQGSDWPGRFIFEANDIVVHHAYQKRSLFEMLSKNRGDMLFRSVIAGWSEKQEQLKYGLELDSKLVVRYPCAVYFFVHKDNPTLAESISVGLEAAIDDGSFDDIFFLMLNPVLAESRLEKRVILDIENPFVSRGMPLDDRRLWYSLSSKEKPSSSEVF